jgi:hypothetical protein
MSKEKQIEEMTKTIDQAKYDMWVGKAHQGGDFTNHSRNIAKALYNAGYRKQSDWISVDERLPEEKVMVLGFLKYVYEEGGSNEFILTMEISREGKFVPFNCSPVKKGIVTHWMPLPEAPNMQREVRV